MAETAHEHQLGDFIRGRMLFIEDYCRKHALSPEKTVEAIKVEAFRLAGTPDRKRFLEERLFGKMILSSSILPDWLDRVFLEAMTHALKGPGASLSTKSSGTPCVASEAGRFNAHRQADSVFQAFFSRKGPAEWLRGPFPTIYRKCYGDSAADRLVVEELAPQKFRLTMDNRELEKASPVDCSTIIGYVQGALEKVGAHEVVVVHESCGAGRGPSGSPCVFEATWK